MKNIFKIVACVLVCYFSFLGTTQASTEVFANRKDVKQYIQEVSKQHGLDKQALTELFKKFGSEQKVLALIAKPAETVPWYQYKARVVTDERAKKGVLFWKAHRAVLQKAEKQFGVPASIIIAILGVESYYGEITGNYPVVQSLATLAFDYPRRQKFFRKELTEFLLLTKENNLNPATIKGSYAGAMSTAQFMPSSYRRYAVDFSGKGKIDLLNDMNDVIGSVANYFKIHGWKPGEKIIRKVKINNKKQEALITLDATKNSKEHWLPFENFKVIKRYNPNNLYAMAVYQLSEQIQAHAHDKHHK